VKEKKKEKKKARTAALDSVERLNRAQIIQRQLQTIKESDEQIITIINELQRNYIYCQLIRGRDVKN
jgi:hypothetical protein